MKFRTPTRAAATLTVGMVLLVATTIFAQQLSERRSGDETTTKLVCSMISQYHIKQSDINDGISGQLLTTFVEQLDPQKMYFTQADIDSFDRYKTQLDDLLKQGNVDFAFEAFDLYLRRLDERVALAQKLIDAEHDFTVNETMITDTDELTWPRTPEEIQDRWRKRIKYDVLTLKLDGTEPEEIRKRLHKRYEMVVTTMRQTEAGEKLEMYLSALAHCFDPHSSFMSAETLEDFQIQMRLSLDGIGAALRAEDGYTVVAEIVAGGAAAKDGRLKAGDKIVGVGQGEDGEFVDIVEMKLSRVVRLIRGKAGSIVRLQVKPGETNEIKVYQLERQKIELKSAEVKGEIIETGERLADGRAARIGIIHIPSFYRDFGGAQNGLDNFKSTVRDVSVVLADFKKQGGVDAVVVDLRMNGGGALKEAIDVSGLFISEGPVVQVKEQDGNIKSHDDEDSRVFYSGPLVVLTNRLSASASEIFAGVIKDYRRGIIVGDTTTHGKGTVQNVMPVPSGVFDLLSRKPRGALKLTINQFYRVNGDSTQNRGVPSDVVLPSLIDHMDLGESFMKNALAFDRVQPADYVPVGMVSPEVISALKRSSQQRVQNDPEFQKLQKEIEKYVARKERKSVSLNEEVLKAERAEDKAKEDKEKDEAKSGDEPIFPKDHYNDEVLQITLDYLSLLKGHKTARN